MVKKVMFQDLEEVDDEAAETFVVVERAPSGEVRRLARRPDAGAAKRVSAVSARGPVQQNWTSLMPEPMRVTRGCGTADPSCACVACVATLMVVPPSVGFVSLTAPPGSAEEKKEWERVQYIPARGEIHLRDKKNSRWKMVSAIFDSGSGISMIGKVLAEKLGLTIEARKPEEAHGVLGVVGEAHLLTHFANVQVRVGNFVYKTRAAVMYGERLSTTLLLGLDFLNAYRATLVFNDDNSHVHLRGNPMRVGLRLFRELTYEVVKSGRRVVLPAGGEAKVPAEVKVPSGVVFEDPGCGWMVEALAADS